MGMWRDTNLVFDYMSDIHLENVLDKCGVESLADVKCALRNMEIGELDRCLVAGDIAHTPKLFKLFIKELAEFYENSFVVLGNQDYWKYSSIDQCVSCCRDICNKMDVTLLSNSLVYLTDLISLQTKSVSCNLFDVNEISYSELMSLDVHKIEDKLRSARVVILGGTGFAGYNNKYNVSAGLYKTVIDRDTEIAESKKFETLYNKLLPVLQRHNSIVLTHNPKEDWCSNPEPDKGVLYVHGHTHKNYAYDDGDVRVYANAQTGYDTDTIVVGNTYIDGRYNVFENYEDGVYEIRAADYQEFLRGTMIGGSFNCKSAQLFMIKQKGWYMFLFRGKDTFNILKGGKRKALPKESIDFFKDNMVSVAEKVYNGKHMEYKVLDTWV